ncbi:Beta-1,4-N-acetylgalactosaminyltransferase bre-4 [Aphelenchoides besseyi]|nr:Beta-1,4-N-acetylgalactosaminyltransferase bre-4 [Aphelenchoides besseyi]KAI6208125.1 Beta-1,4-N-acetylgalactosaminyltransferase bre-4 [Aphelenchoides besseyi]
MFVRFFKSWSLLFFVVIIFLIYIVGLQLDEQFVDSSWLPKRLSIPWTYNSSEEDDPLFAILNSTEPPLNFTSGFPVNVTLLPNIFQTQPPNLNYCLPEPPNLSGPIKVFLDSPPFKQIETLYPNLEIGGHGKPEECKARHRVAIIVPYRDRESHLRIFLHNLHGFLQKQQLDYAIFIVEQIANQTFNRAKLMNVGFVEANRFYDFNCMIFHDIDLLPEDDRNLYSCPEKPRHMSVAVDKFNYKLPYATIFGGVSALTKQQYLKMNGFSNDYWGWGGEDDEQSTRVSLAGFQISRYPLKIARYKMIKHTQESSNPINKCRYKLMRLTKRRYRMDGLSSLIGSYNVISIDRQPLYTHILVDLLETLSKARLRNESAHFRNC